MVKILNKDKTTKIPSFSEMNSGEKSYINEADKVEKDKKTKTHTARTVTVHDEVWDSMVSFLKEYPAEGNKSSFVTRAINELVDARLSAKKKQ